MKKEKDVFYSLWCSACGDHIGIGNWKDALMIQYEKHLHKVHKPIIKLVISSGKKK